MTNISTKTDDLIDKGIYEIKVKRHVKDVRGTTCNISGTHDVCMASPLDIDVFPEPGCPWNPTSV